MQGYTRVTVTVRDHDNDFDSTSVLVPDGFAPTLVGVLKKMDFLVEAIPAPEGPLYNFNYDGDQWYYAALRTREEVLELLARFNVDVEDLFAQDMPVEIQGAEVDVTPADLGLYTYEPDNPGSI